MHIYIHIFMRILECMMQTGSAYAIMPISKECSK